MQFSLHIVSLGVTIEKLTAEQIVDATRPFDTVETLGMTTLYYGSDGKVCLVVVQTAGE